MVYNFGKTINATYLPRLISNNGTSYDTNSVMLHFQSGIVASIFTSYATPLIDNMIIIGTDGYVIIKDNVLELNFPRDTFDSNGLFTKPKIHQEIEFNFQSIIDNSLRTSVDYFVQNIEKGIPFDSTNFDKAIYTNKLVLDLEKNYNEWL